MCVCVRVFDYVCVCVRKEVLQLTRIPKLTKPDLRQPNNERQQAQAEEKEMERAEGTEMETERGGMRITTFPLLFL